MINGSNDFIGQFDNGQRCVCVEFASCARQEALTLRFERRHHSRDGAEMDDNVVFERHLRGDFLKLRATDDVKRGDTLSMVHCHVRGFGAASAEGNTIIGDTGHLIRPEFSYDEFHNDPSLRTVEIKREVLHAGQDKTNSRRNLGPIVPTLTLKTCVLSKSGLTRAILWNS
ncbi:unnamed protein product [Nesidiocoris tenuis]|uniref:Uncharacterized protein n=1 Tax=Nesidiocoris tenuis TaxID=355587 RepID=A0A6H5H5L1_9HEMI|nr:unnamed protein product [Nesidiocoris tenuis]